MEFEQFLKHGLYIKNWSPKTVKIYRRAWASWQRENCELTKANLENWVFHLHEKGHKPAGISIYTRAINSYLSWLRSEKPELSWPLKLKLIRVPTKPLRGFSDSEIRSLLSFRPKTFFELRTFTLIQTLLDTGIRIEEALTLRTANLNLDSLVFSVVGKGDKVRFVPLSVELRKVLFRFQKSIKDGFVFCTHDGLKLSYRNTYRDIKNLCSKAGVSGPHVHPHSFRHCFAVTYVRRGGDIYRLSRILGHTSISTTQIYLRSMGIEAISENHSSFSPLSHR